MHCVCTVSGKLLTLRVCEIWEYALTHWPLFQISCHMHSTDLGVDFVAYCASAAVQEFTERLTGIPIPAQSFSNSVQRQLQANAPETAIRIFPEIRITPQPTQIMI